MATTDKIRIGLLGFSDIARRRFLPAMRTVRNAEVTAIGSRDPGKAVHEASLPSCAGRTYDALVDSADVDLVYISLPNHLHEEWTLRALNSGKHVLCEKPLGLSFDSVERMTACAQQKGLLLTESLAYLHHPVQQRVRSLVEQGVLGRVQSLRAAFGFPLQASHGFRLVAEHGGGCFHDLARYPLSAALSFLRGGTYRICGYSFCRNGLDMSMQATAATSGGEAFSFSIGFEQPYECWYEIAGDRGRLRVDRAFTAPAGRTMRIELSVDGAASTVDVPPADHFAALIEQVCTRALGGGTHDDEVFRTRRLALLADQARAGCERVLLPYKGRTAS